MLQTRQAAVLASALSLLGLAGAPSPARAELMSRWGHPVFTIGMTPYYTTDQGHGEYPGSAGFLPGYGYYPGSESGHYPWLTGPGDMGYFRPHHAPPGPPAGMPVGPVPSAVEEESVPPDVAAVVVKVPAEAEVFINGVKTTQGGSYRRFVTPPLAADGKDSFFRIQARWVLKDALLMREERLEVRPGQRSTVNFLTAEGWKGWRYALPGPPLSEGAK